MTDLSTIRALAEKAHVWAIYIDNDGTPSQVGPTPDELRDVAAAILSLVEEVERLRKALTEIVIRLDAITPAANELAVFAHAHGYVYSGPNYADELAAARAALSTEPVKP